MLNTENFRILDENALRIHMNTSIQQCKTTKKNHQETFRHHTLQSFIYYNHYVNNNQTICS